MSQISSKAIPVDLCDLLVKLQFLSMIKRGSKINTNTMNFVESDSWLGALKRMVSHENRRTTLTYVYNTIDLAIDAINKYAGSEYFRILINSLATARLGIAELITTYREDPEVISHIKVCLANIDIQLNKHKSLIRGNDEISFELPPIDKNIIDTLITPSAGSLHPLQSSSPKATSEK